MKAGYLPKLLFSPSAFLVLVCVYGYIMFTIYLSFTTSTMLPTYDWAGTANYTRLLGLANWQVSLANLATFASLYIVIAMALGLALAILIDQKIRAESAFRSIFLYPMALSFIVTGTAWKWLLDPGVGLERSMHLLGWESFSFTWIKDSEMAIYCVVIAAVWQTSGFVMAMFLAGLRGVDQSIIRAAQVDGASLPTIYLKIVLPSLRPVFFSAFMILAHIAIKSFDLVAAMTAGGPGYSSDLPAMFMYSFTFSRGQMGIGSASAMLMLGAVLTILVPYLYSELRGKRHD